MTNGKKHKKYEAHIPLKIAQEIDAGGGQHQTIARICKQHSIPPATATGWYMKLKTYGAESLHPRNAIGQKKSLNFQMLEARVSRIEKELGISILGDLT